MEGKQKFEFMGLNLYKVTCRGMKYSASGPVHGVSYVVAEDASQAYDKVRAYLDEKDLGFASERCMETVELIASASNYPECKTRLFLS